MKIIVAGIIAATAFLSCSIIGLADVENADNPACVPMKRTDWSEPVTKMWADKATKQKATEGGIDVLFLGDSITQLWYNDPRWPNGQEAWDKNYKPLKAINLGVAGDTTCHLIWRIGEGRMIEGLTPKVTILLIGVNNITGRGKGSSPGSGTPENIAAAIVLILDNLKKQMPDTKILLLGIFPAFPDQSDSKWLEKIHKTNKIIAEQADYKKIFYLDIGNKLLSSDGKLDKEIIRDGIHLSEKGYEIWAENMNPYLLDLLNNNGKGKMWDAVKGK
ncbi:MAG: GDSL-type esterase/lipase family protein [Victivallales bacterium]